MEKHKLDRRIALAFDDVLLVPRRSNILPGEVDVSTVISKKIKLNIPVMSAAMDTVTEHEMAIALAREGGLGVIHRNMSAEDQAREVRKVKRSESWIIKDPVTVEPEDTLGDVKKLIESRNVASFPVVMNGKVVGILTNRDMRFQTNMKKKVKNLMTRDVITGLVGISMEKAIRILHKNRIEKLPLVDKSGKLRGLITFTDIEKSRKYPSASKDREGRLLVGASIGPFDMKRVDALVKAGVDLIVVDTAHGHSENVIKTIRQLKKEFDVEVVGGNVVTKDGAEELISAGADIIKVGMGPGSICTTRIISGSGVPQVTAVQDCYEVSKKHGVHVISDGGIKYSGDIAKAIAAGASCVMIGSLLGGTEESPGRVIYVDGRKYKSYRGMGSLGAIQTGSRDRYPQAMKSGKAVPEGVEGIVPYRGTVSEVVFQLVGGLKSAMGYCGCRNIVELQKNSKFIMITKAGMAESHPHGVKITEGTPNYWL